MKSSKTQTFAQISTLCVLLSAWTRLRVIALSAKASPLAIPTGVHSESCAWALQFFWQRTRGYGGLLEWATFTTNWGFRSFRCVFRSSALQLPHPAADSACWMIHL